jgi:hypothetical protein
VSVLGVLLGVPVLDLELVLVVQRGRASCSEKTQTMWTTILLWIMVAYDVYAELLGWEVSKVLKRYEKGRTTI